MKFVFLFSFLLLACQKPLLAPERDVAVPLNEGTAEENQFLLTIQDELQHEFDQMGIPVRLGTLPLVLTDRADLSNEPYLAICQWDDLHHGQYIAVLRKVVQEDMKNPQPGFAPETWRILLHEIGHCYFGREHEKTVISEAGRALQVNVAGFVETYPWVPHSAMVVESYIRMPEQLKRYYLAEMGGLVHFSVLSDVAGYVGAEMVPCEGGMECYVPPSNSSLGSRSDQLSRRDL